MTFRICHLPFLLTFLHQHLQKLTVLGFEDTRPVVISLGRSLTFSIVPSLPQILPFQLFPALCELTQCRGIWMDSLAFLWTMHQQCSFVLHCPTHEYLFLSNDLLSTVIHSAAPWPCAQYEDHAQCAGEVQQAFTPVLPADSHGRSTLSSFCSYLQLFVLFCSCSLPSCSCNSW